MFLFLFSSFVQDCLSPLSMQGLPAAPESFSLLQLGASVDDRPGSGGAHGTLFLNVGLQVCKERVRRFDEETTREVVQSKERVMWKKNTI